VTQPSLPRQCCQGSASTSSPGGHLPPPRGWERPGSALSSHLQGQRMCEWGGGYSRRADAPLGCHSLGRQGPRPRRLPPFSIVEGAHVLPASSKAVTPRTADGREQTSVLRLHRVTPSSVPSTATSQAAQRGVQPRLPGVCK
jgi:hypothetical protein